MGNRIKLGAVAEVPDNDFKVFHLEAIDIVVYNVDGAYFGVSTYCPHAGVNIARGPLDKKVVTCPGHGLKFDVTTGACLDRSDLALTRFNVEVDNDELFVVF